MAKQNGHLNGAATKPNEQALTKPRRPRQSKNGGWTPEDGEKYQQYIRQLRDWLNSLSDEEHDRVIKRLPGRDLDQVIDLDVYESYQKGGPLRELLEGTCFEGTL